MKKISVPSDFRVIAHRGASYYMPENTRGSFDKAIELNAIEIEIDVRLSSDSHIVVCHDSNLNRYGQGDRAVSDLTWSELKQLDMSSWFDPLLKPVQRMPLLSDILREYSPKVILHIELREESPILCDRLTTALCETNAEINRIVLTSSWFTNLKYLKSKNSFFQLAWLVNELTPEVLDKAQALKPYQLCPKVETVTAEMSKNAKNIVPELRGRGCTGTFEQVSTYVRKLIECGINGATVDAPDWFEKI